MPPFIPTVFSLSLAVTVTWFAAILEVSKPQGVDHVIQTGMQCRNIPGLAAAVVRDGQVILNRGYGVKDLDSQEPVTPDTMFQIASLTKAFTAVQLSDLLAADRRKGISINVYKTLPGGYRFNNTLRSTYATLEDLLAHRTGIPRNNYARLASDYSIQSFASKIRYLPHKGGFRDSFYYNDIMYGLAAHITEQLGQMPWKQQIQQTIFRPLGMTRSTFVDDVDFENDDIATPYLRESRRMVQPSMDFVRHWSKNTGSGNIVSTTSDMARWMLMLLADGRDSRGRRVLREGVVEEVFTPQNVVPLASYSHNYRRPVTPESFTGDSYALGWRVGFYKGQHMIHHSGSTFGYRAYLTLLPDMNVGVVSLMTGSDYQYKFRTALHMHLLDHALGHTPWINSSSICSFPEPWRSSRSRPRRSSEQHPTMDEEIDQEDEEENEEEVSMTEQQRQRRASAVDRPARSASLSLSRYVGRFRHAAYGTLVVRQNAGFLELEYGVGLWRLVSAGGHEFEGQWLHAPPTLNFSFRFKARRSRVYAVEGVGFQRSRPPMFYRR